MITLRRTVHDASGRPVADYVPGTRAGHPWADDLRPKDGVSPDETADAVLAALPGWLVGAPEEIGAALLAGGARKHRHAHCFSWDFAARRVDPAWAVPELRPGLRLESALSHEAADLTSLWMSAYPPGHPDNPDGETFDSARTQLALLFDGQVLGPLLACSTVIVDGTRPVAASLVSGRDGEPPLGGPWITEVFRHADPEYAGLGAVALRASLALAADEGLPALGLAVTDGNPARRTYERIGFAHVESTITVVVPE